MQGNNVSRGGLRGVFSFEIYCVVAQLDLAIFAPNAKKAGWKKNVVVGAVALIPSMAKKRGPRRKEEKKNKEEEEDTISSFYDKE